MTSDTEVRDPLPEEVDELSAAVARYAEDPDGFEGREIHYNGLLVAVEVDIGGFKRMDYPASRSELMDMVADMPLQERANLDHYAPDLFKALQYVIADGEVGDVGSAMDVYAEIISDTELMDFTQQSVAQNYTDLRRMYPVLTDLAEHRGFFDGYFDAFERVDELDLSEHEDVTNGQIADYIQTQGIESEEELRDTFSEVYDLARSRTVLSVDGLEPIPLLESLFQDGTYEINLE